MRVTHFIRITLTLLLLGVGSASAGGLCSGKMFNPAADPNWDNFFPLTIGGFKGGGNMNPPEMYIPPLCWCPGKITFGTVPTPGIGVSYWQPANIAEVVDTPGCMPSVGGTQLTNSFSMIRGEAKDPGGNQTGSGSTSKVSRKQVHWYRYPVFALMQMFTDLVCNQTGSFGLLNMTEPNYPAQSDAQMAVLSPETVPLSAAGPIFTMASSSVDSLATSTLGFGLAPIFWTAGSAGAILPYTVNAPESNSDQMKNMNLLTRQLGMFFRIGGIFASIGPTAYCGATYSPIIMKNQYRYDYVYPRARGFRPIYAGQSEMFWGLFPPANYPNRESSTLLLWQGTQCCGNF